MSEAGHEEVTETTIDSARNLFNETRAQVEAEGDTESLSILDQMDPDDGVLFAGVIKAIANGIFPTLAPLIEYGVLHLDVVAEAVASSANNVLRFINELVTDIEDANF